MRRYLLILLLLILPFQFSWAAAARYCQHETASAAAARHLGHHEHRHQDPAPDVDKKAVADTDCGVCHAISLPFVDAQPARLDGIRRAQPLHATHRAAFTSMNARAPDRPQWLRLA